MMLLYKWRGNSKLYSFHRHRLYISPLHILVQLCATLHLYFLVNHSSLCEAYEDFLYEKHSKQWVALVLYPHLTEV